MKDFPTQIINRVNNTWEANASQYQNGYAVFYGRVTPNPPLMLVGLNPGGDQTGRDWKTDALALLDKEQDYIRCARQSDYPLARRTYALFEEMGKLVVLRQSVKTNIVFYPSKDWDRLPDKRKAIKTSKPIVAEIIQQLKPRVLLCESMAVLDRLTGLLYKGKTLKQLETYKRSNRRKYVSYTCGDPDVPAKVIGVTHLTGSRPSNNDMEQIKRLLLADLSDSLP